MMRFNTNKWITRNGSIIEVSWDTTGMSNPKLKMKVAEKETIIDLDTIGSKKFRLGGNAFRRDMSLIATDSKGIERHIDRTIFTLGKPKDSYQYDSYTRISPLKSKLLSYWQYVKQFWLRFPTEKRRLYLILLFLMTSLTFVSSDINIAKTLIIITIGYILYLIIKK